MSIVLASASPRRRELMQMLGVQDLKIIPAVGEEKAPDAHSPAELVKALAAHKAREVALQAGPEDIIIAADTIVWHRGCVFGKPHSEAEAADMLRALSGESHAVYTGVAVLRGDTLLSECERSAVHFRPLTEREISAYIATGEPMDKAGAYGIQGRGAMLVEGIRGDYFTVVGLPVCALAQALKRYGIDPLEP